MAMENQTESESGLGRLWRWLKTPPQIYVFYLVLLILVWMVSFYAGTLNPKKGQGLGPPPIAAPKN